METIGLKIDKKLKSDLKTFADQTDRSLSAMARICLEHGLVFFQQGGSHQTKKNLSKVAVTGDETNKTRK